MITLTLFNGADGDSPYSCQHSTLDCIRNKPYQEYNCTASAPVYGDSCIEIDRLQEVCQEILNISVSEDVETNWTDSTIYLKVTQSLRLHSGMKLHVYNDITTSLVIDPTKNILQ